MKTIQPLQDFSMPAPGTKILFACFPAEGHFNPLTGFAKHLISIGCDVRWYASRHFAHKLDKLQIPYYLFDKALDPNFSEIEKAFPERADEKGKIAKLNFDIINVFLKRSVEYYEDIKTIQHTFNFELVIADVCFTGIPFIKDKMHIPVVSVGIVPLNQKSADVAPAGLGIMPSHSVTGKLKQRLLNFIAHHILFAKANKALRTLFAEHNMDHNNYGVFDMLIYKSTLLLQIGSPGFEYKRRNLAANVRFVGSLLPYAQKKTRSWYDEKLSQYNKVILLTQGTVEKDVNKLIIPTLEAFKETSALVVVTTGGSQTEELRKRYPYKNIIIEDFIPFNDVMPYADVYITNGGYGGVLLSITNGLPLVVAGVHEGKNEINARIGYFELGVNLNTEIPSVVQLRSAVQEVLENNKYSNNIKALCGEFAHYDSLALSTHYIAEIISNSHKQKPAVKNLQQPAMAE